MDDWLSRFEELDRLPKALQDVLRHGSSVVSVPAGTVVFEPGQAADNLLLLLDGVVRVQQRSATGRDVVLYRVHAGESCILTTATVLAHENYSAEGQAETDVTAAIIPRSTFDDLAGKSPDFRAFVFRAYARRITDLSLLIDDIVFQRMDVRLAARLLQLAGDGDTVRATHQFLATELGTAREVISRTLSEFQRRGWVEQSRGEVRLASRTALSNLTRSSAEM